MNQKVKAKIGLLFITILWASAPSLIKIALTELQEFNLIWLRFTAAFIFLFIIFHKRIINTDRSTVIKAFYLAVVLLLVFISMTYGIKYTTASKAGFLTCVTAAFVPVFTFVIFKRKPELTVVSGILVTIIGVGMMTLKSNFSINLGDMLCIISSILYGLYIILIESYASKTDPIVLSIIQMGFVGLMSGIVSLILEKPHLPEGSGVWTSVIIMAFLCTGAAFIVQTISQKYVGSEDAAIITSLEPLFAAVFAALLLQEFMSSKEIKGAVIMLMGVVITQLDMKKIKKYTSSIREV